MYVEQFNGENSNKRLDSILHTLSSLQGVDYSFLKEMPLDQIESLREASSAYTQKLLAEKTFNSFQQNPEYVSNKLLAEACRIVLSEYKPGSRRKTRKKSKKPTSQKRTKFVTREF